MPEERENLASNRQWRQNTVAGTGQDEYYTYDGLYQVSTLKRGTLTGNPPSGISGTPSWEENWNYDPTGNWRGSSTGYLTKVNGSTTLNQNRTHNVANEITDITESTGTAWPTPTQDAAGNLTVIPRPLSLGNSFDLKWDAWNRLVEVKNTGGSVIATYRYDGATRRVTKYDGTNTRHYYYSDQWQVLEERLNSSSSADRRFVWGLRSVDDLILRDDTSQRLYALSDAMGSVTAVVDTGGGMQQRYGYDGFGTPRYMDADFDPGSELFGWETLFDGYRYDRDSGLYQVRYRFLHPSLGRWLSRDPIGEIVFGNSSKHLQSRSVKQLFTFCNNAPISRYDANGLVDEFPFTFTFCLDPCEEYKQLREEENPGGGMPSGKPICCGGTLYFCNWSHSQYSGTAAEIIKQCGEAHEEAHEPHVNPCDPSCWHPTGADFIDPSNWQLYECEARIPQFVCLWLSRNLCGEDPDCLRQIDEVVEKTLSEARRFCKNHPIWKDIVR